MHTKVPMKVAVVCVNPRQRLPVECSLEFSRECSCECSRECTSCGLLVYHLVCFHLFCSLPIMLNPSIRRVSSTPDRDALESITMQLPCPLQYLYKNMLFCWLKAMNASSICMTYTSHLCHAVFAEVLGSGSLEHSSSKLVPGINASSLLAAFWSGHFLQLS